MKIYLYDSRTFEFISEAEADSDPQETKLQGKFVPLVPACATLISPPEYGENEIPVFENRNWTVYPDYRGKYCKVSQDMTVEDITEIGSIEDKIIVPLKIGEEIRQTPEAFKIADGKILKKTPEEIQSDQAMKREAYFKSEFFETSLGWIRRSVSMKDGSKRDFLSDLLLPIKTGLEMNQPVKIITYNIPDFGQEFTVEYLESLQEIKPATLEFIQECLMQTVKDFGL